MSDECFLNTFRLPGVPEKRERLKGSHPFPREGDIFFKEDSHEYFVNGEKVPRSVTGLIHKYSGEFDPWSAIRSMKGSPRWEERQLDFLTADGEVMSDAEIVQKWSNHGRVQSARGTLFHYHVEQFLNGCSIETPHSPEFQQFLTMYREVIQPRYTVYRTELCVYSDQLKLAGQLDGLFKDSLQLWQFKNQLIE